ncbi:hypothetical protein [Streptomyces sp. NPDC058613]|uniref:hypothetical protein n=1 Tax=Streptomyces sp. NPDC058613 TaxID=3346556 RepID=UPI0036664E46
MSEDRKLLEPLAAVVSTGTRLLLGLLLAGVVLNIVSGTIPFWSGASTCVTADWTSGTSATADTAFTALDGASVSSIPRYCADNPSTGQRALGALSEAPALVLLVGGLVVLNQLLRAAARNGVHTRQTASRIRFLGWWLLIGSLAAELAQAVSQAALLTTLTGGATLAGVALHTATFPYLAVLTGLGLLVFGRIVSAGATMREDLEGIV